MQQIVENHQYGDAIMIHGNGEEATVDSDDDDDEEEEESTGDSDNVDEEEQEESIVDSDNDDNEEQEKSTGDTATTEDSTVDDNLTAFEEEREVLVSGMTKVTMSLSLNSTYSFQEYAVCWTLLYIVCFINSRLPYIQEDSVVQEKIQKFYSLNGVRNVLHLFCEQHSSTDKWTYALIQETLDFDDEEKLRRHVGMIIVLARRSEFKLILNCARVNILFKDEDEDVSTTSRYYFDEAIRRYDEWMEMSDPNIDYSSFYDTLCGWFETYRQFALARRNFPDDHDYSSDTTDALVLTSSP